MSIDFREKVPEFDKQVFNHFKRENFLFPSAMDSSDH